MVAIQMPKLNPVQRFEYHLQRLALVEKEVTKWSKTQKYDYLDI